MQERRKAPRFTLGITGMLHPAGGGVGTKVYVPVISTQGCSIEGAEGPPPGKKCEIYLDWRGSQIGVEAQVISRDARGRMGLKFVSLDKDMQRRLSDLCVSLNAPPQAAPLAEEVETDRFLGDTVKAGRATRAAARQPSAASSPPPPPPQERERRRVPRYVGDLRARLFDSTDGGGSRVTLTTLSVLGGCVEGEALPGAGQKCEIETEWQGRPLRLEGEVVWKSKEGRVGVKFVSLDEDAARLLRQICANLRLQPMAPLPPEP